jgi:hypothetical protein
MTKLRANFEALGFQNVATFIASGNVLFDADSTTAARLGRQRSPRSRRRVSKDQRWWTRLTQRECKDEWRQNHEAEGDPPRSIGMPAQHALVVAGYTRLAQLTLVSEAELLRLQGVSPKAIRLLRKVLAAQGLAFARRDR